jgi:hypothetical protein
VLIPSPEQRTERRGAVAGRQGLSCRVSFGLNAFSCIVLHLILSACFDELQKALISPKNWCCRTGLNCRPLHYQWSALPLSYGSMPRITRIGPKGPSRRADPCHKGPGFASARRRFRTLKAAESAWNRPLSPRFADIAAKIRCGIAGADDKCPTAAKLSPAHWRSGASPFIAASISATG